VDVIEGRTAVMGGVCEGSPWPHIKCLFRGKEIKEGGRYNFIKKKDEYLGLEICGTRMEDAGEYTLLARSKSGTKYHPIASATFKCQLRVNDSSKTATEEEDARSAPTFFEKLLKVEVDAGQTAVIASTCHGNPRPTIQWEYKGEPIKNEFPYKYLSEDDNIIGLEIEDIDESDAGEYTCTATNEKGEDSFSCQLNVNEPPQNDETRSHQSSDDEEEVECEAFDEEENPSLNATQESSKDEEEAQCNILNESEEQNPPQNDETRSHQSSDDEEEVECEAPNETENQSPPKFAVGSVTVEVESGQPAAIANEYEGPSNPTVEWKFGGTSISNGDRYTFLSEKVVKSDGSQDDIIGLEIENVTSDDEGVYTCTATTGNESASYTGHLNVN